MQEANEVSEMQLHLNEVIERRPFSNNNLLLSGGYKLNVQNIPVDHLISEKNSKFSLVFFFSL